jgi:hypothetical protein
VNYNELKTKSLFDDNFAKQMSYKLSDSDERASFFTWISSLGSHWQENPTPFEIIRKMVSKTSLNDKHILVLFNIEFLHVLIDEQGVSPQHITFIADNKIEKLCANKIFKVQSYCLSDYTVPALNKLIAGINMKFDLVFSNPPYNRGSDIKIINEILGFRFIVIGNYANRNRINYLLRLCRHFSYLNLFYSQSMSGTIYHIQHTNMPTYK